MKHIILRMILVGFICTAILFNISYYFDLYYVHLNAETSEDWQYGYARVVQLTEQAKTKYKKIVVSTSLDQSYIFFLFYTKYDPAKYILNGGSGRIYDHGVRHAFDAYEFRRISWNIEAHDGTVLYVGTPNDIPTSQGQTISLLNGKPAFVIAE